MLSPAHNTAPPGHTCIHCQSRTPIRVFISPLLYRTPLSRRLIHELKYRRITALAPLLSDIIISYMEHYRIKIPAEALIIPIPLHPRKERVRGFNQAELIARIISNHFSLTLNTNILIRHTANSPQALLSATLRHKNVHNIFSTQKDVHLRGKTIILVDDIKTTGATLEQASRALKKAGAKNIWAITVAH